MVRNALGAALTNWTAVRLFSLAAATSEGVGVIRPDGELLSPVDSGQVARERDAT